MKVSNLLIEIGRTVCLREGGWLNIARWYEL